MKKRISAVKAICAVLTTFLSHQASAVATSVDLKDAYRSALEKTETVPLGQTRIQQATERSHQARSRFLPTLSFDANYQAQETTVAQSHLRLTTTQSIYNGGRDSASLRGTKSDEDLQKQNLTVANYALFSDVAREFYAVLSGQTEVENLKKTIEFAAERVSEINAREKIGRSRNIENLAAQAQLSVIKAQLLAAEGQLITARDQFTLVTGLPRETELIKTKEIPSPPQKIETYLLALDKRPDIAMFKAQVNIAQSKIDSAKAGHLPKVDLLANYYPVKNTIQKGNDWDAGVTMNLLLFQGGLVSAQVAEASHKLSENEYLLSQSRRLSEITIRTSYHNLESSLNQITALESALKSTEQNYREQEKNYRFGQATNLDVIQALNLFQDTKRSLDRTRYLALSAAADLKAATAQISLAELPDPTDAKESQKEIK